MNLEIAAQSLHDQFPGGQSPDIVRREELLERFGRIAFGGFGVVLLLAVFGLIFTIITKMVLSGEQPVVGILLCAFIVFAVMSLAYVIFNEDLKDRRQRIRSQERGVLTGDAVAGKLIEERPFEPVPTVTENTTDLLPREKTRRL